MAIKKRRGFFFKSKKFWAILMGKKCVIIEKLFIRLYIYRPFSCTSFPGSLNYIIAKCFKLNPKLQTKYVLVITSNSTTFPVNFQRNYNIKITLKTILRTTTKITKWASGKAKFIEDGSKEKYLCIICKHL